MLRDKFTLGIILVSLLILGGAYFVFSQAASSTTSSSEAVVNPDLLTIKDDDWAEGSPDTAVTLIEYLDFECEACGAYYPMLKQLKEEYHDDIRFVVRYFPLPGHKNSMPAALSVEAAGKQGKFWEMHNILYEKQKEWAEQQSTQPALFEKYAKEIGLNMDKYKKDVQSQEAKDRVNRDVVSGTTLGVQGTPTFFMNGKKITNPQSYEEFTSIIDKEISENKETVQ
jgi:protein-disulfide isomerase